MGDKILKIKSTFHGIFHGQQLFRIEGDTFLCNYQDCMSLMLNICHTFYEINVLLIKLRCLIDWSRLG